MEYYLNRINELRQQINSTTIHLSTLEEKLNELWIEIANQQANGLLWLYPSREIRFAVSPEKSLTNPELIPLLNFATLTGIPYEIIGDGSRRYYLETLLLPHRELLENAGIIIENKTA